MKKIFIRMIEFYIKNMSNMKKAPTCKYLPTCSHYGLEAIQTHGAFKGFFMTVWRVLRCNPFSKGGFDPVPEDRS